MFYLGLGADFQRDDLYYLYNLLSSINADLDALVSSGSSSFTEGRAKLLIDKLSLRADAIEKYNAIGAGADNIRSLMQTTAADVNTLNEKIESKLASIKSWAPVADKTAFTAPVYKYGVPFTAPPTIYAKNVLAPSPATLANLSAPIATRLTAADLQTYKLIYSQGGIVGLTRSKSLDLSKKSLPTAAMVGVAALAALWFMNR